MMGSMTEDRFTALERICGEATPGPWCVEEISETPVIVSRDRGGDGSFGMDRNEDSFDGGVVTGMGGPWTYRAIPGPFGNPPLNNYNFIAEARTALPEALAEIRRLREELRIADSVRQNMEVLLYEHCRVESSEIREFHEFRQMRAKVIAEAINQCGMTTQRDSVLSCAHPDNPFVERLIRCEDQAAIDESLRMSLHGIPEAIMDNPFAHGSSAISRDTTVPIHRGILATSPRLRTESDADTE
jgi:hypothetical protein